MLPQYPTLSSMGASGIWLCWWRLISSLKCCWTGSTLQKQTQGKSKAHSRKIIKQIRKQYTMSEKSWNNQHTKTYLQDFRNLNSQTQNTELLWLSCSKKWKTNFKIPSGNRRLISEEICFVGVNHLLLQLNLVNTVKLPRSGMLSTGISKICAKCEIICRKSHFSQALGAVERNSHKILPSGWRETWRL